MATPATTGSGSTSAESRSRRGMTTRKKERIVTNRVVRDEDELSDDQDSESAAPGYFDQIHSGEDEDSACEDLEEEDPAASEASIVPEGVMQRLAPRTLNFVIRGFSGLTLLSSFVGLVAMGPSGLLLLSYAVLTSSFNEVMKLGYSQCQVKDKKTHRFCWALFFLANFALDGKPCLEFLSSSFNTLSPEVSQALGRAAKVHSAIVFGSYLSAIVWFVTSMRTTNYLGRYALFGWCHTTLLLTTIPVHLINQTIFTHGTIFYVSAMIIITINDICAYYVGFFAGRTPLIKLSPKKTLEGYLGGGLLTMILGTAFAAFLLRFPSLRCPATVTGDPATYFGRILTYPPAILTQTLFTTSHCGSVTNPMFFPSDYQVGSSTFNVAPFVIHGLVISVFASILGPFAGFLASGFKRACNRKNFGGLIPGHGGVVDRCDCMFLMAAFINVYLSVVDTSSQLTD